MGIIDAIVFVLFVLGVIGTGLWKSRNEKSQEDYFLAGRGLKWWLIGFSLIAANISSEQFVGMSGNAASHVGLAIASYEWMAAIVLAIVAFFFLPYFLKAGIYTMPEFLEYRYNQWARLIMAVSMLLIYMLLLGAVTYSGALTINTMAGEMSIAWVPSVASASVFIGLIAMIYVATGGLKACAWADLIQGSALIIGGGIIMVYAFKMLGNVSEAAYITDVEKGTIAVKTFTPDQSIMERFLDLNRVRLNMFLPRNDAVLPWTALLVGLWIPNFYYWGLNQYITQRTLGSASLAEGQKGIIFSAFMKLLIPFVIVVPGMIAFNLFSSELKCKAVSDNGLVIAKYKMANPESSLVQVVDSPSRDTLETWKDGVFMIAICPNQDTITKLHNKSPYILPVTKDSYENLKIAQYTVFTSDDKSWDEAFPSLAIELQRYNEATRKAAIDNHAAVSIEKLIGYKYDAALGQLLSKVLPENIGLAGFVLAALLGAVVSSLAAMLNAASTIFTMDIYTRYINKQASKKTIVTLGRVSVLLFSLIGISIAPLLGNPKISHSIFMIIQESQGFIAPGILAIFVIGLLVPQAPRCSGVIGLLTSIVSYGLLKVAVPQLQFVNRMAVCFTICLAAIGMITMIKPLPTFIPFRKNTNIELKSSKSAIVAAFFVVLLTIMLYVIFSPAGIAR
jgi:SSS family solute:Na+ symporter